MWRLRRTTGVGCHYLPRGVSSQAQIEFPARPAIADVYKQIYTDLQGAINILGRTNQNAAGTPTYGNQQAAQVLLSRVALYNKDYPTAISNATAAIAGSIKLSTAAGYVAGWRAPRNPESVFELVFTTPENIGVNSSLQTTYTTLVRVGDRGTTGGFGDLVPSPAFLTDIRSETNAAGFADVRAQLYESGTTGRGTAFVETTKFLGKNGTINLDNVPVIRIAEAYLNRAEAYAQSGNAVASLADLNTIRTNRGLVARVAADFFNDKALLAEVLRQRRLEFAFEGQRWFDLKRQGLDIAKFQGLVPYNDPRILAPIPTNELSTNKNLKQNFGY